MLDKYQNWIEQNAPKGSDAYGKCAETTERMIKAFPELKRIRGHYYCYIWGERTHWWLQDQDGSIVDPTATQFPSGGNGHYEAWDESKPEPTGICPNCGDYCYNGSNCCSENCSTEYAAYCMNPR